MSNKNKHIYKFGWYVGLFTGAFTFMGVLTIINIIDFILNYFLTGFYFVLMFTLITIIFIWFGSKNLIEIFDKISKWIVRNIFLKDDD